MYKINLTNVILKLLHNFLISFSHFLSRTTSLSSRAAAHTQMFSRRIDACTRTHARTHMCTYTHACMYNQSLSVSKVPSHTVKTVIVDDRDHGSDLLRKLMSIRSCRALKRANLLSIATLRVKTVLDVG